MVKIKYSAEEFAAKLAELHRVPVCEECDMLRGANLCAIKHFGGSHAARFEKNISAMLTTHVDLGCRPCPVEELMKSLSKDRLAAVAAIF